MSNFIHGVAAGATDNWTGGASAGASGDANGASFVDTLRSALNQVSAVQDDASAKVSSLLRGDGEDVHTAMLASEKADLSFQLMMQVRNKILSAYQEVSQMQF
jgi:flagellar hook-basal body complex protein FliE